MRNRNHVLTTMAVSLGLAMGACSSEPPNNTFAPAKASLAPASTIEIETRPASSIALPQRTEQSQTAALSNRNQQDPTLAVDGDGLRLFDPVTTSASPIPFGRSQSEVVGALERFRGPAGKGTNQDCGAGSVDYAIWPDGLSLVFKGDRFVGWGLDGRAAGAVSTGGSVGPGSTRKQLVEAYADVRVSKTSLGNEFTAGGLAGLLDGPNASSKITDMWAGTSCVAR